MRFGTINIRMMILSEEQLISSTGKERFKNKNVNENVLIFNETILNILSNFIFQELIVFDDKDPPWFNTMIKSFIYEK